MATVTGPGTPRFGVVAFAGTNCELDTAHVLTEVCGYQARILRFEDRRLSDLDAVIIAGGFAHGDYLRAGAIARFDAVMDRIAAFAADGGLVLGICNGFQVLLEAGLLPGAMLRNRDSHFISRPAVMRVENAKTAFTSAYREGQVVRMPMAHGEGRYFASAEDVSRLNAGHQVLFRYCDDRGEVSEAANPNGSIQGIAGIASARGNVAALMPHPERCAEAILGCDDGRALFESMAAALIRQ
jgi:phosphoribosylformylglycinamidine synthase